jgi:hypothetical protein
VADFVDTFTESSDTNLSSHTPDTGTGWTLLTGSASDLKVIAATDILRLDGAPSPPVYCNSDDFSSSNYEVEGKWSGFTSSFGWIGLALESDDTIMGIRLAGTGSAGRRLTSIDAGSVTDEDTTQGVADEWVKVVANGDNTFDWYLGGTGSEPSYGASLGTVDDSASPVWTSTLPGVANRGSHLIAFLTEYRATDLAAGGVIAPTGGLYGPLFGPMAGPI